MHVFLDYYDFLVEKDKKSIDFNESNSKRRPINAAIKKKKKIKTEVQKFFRVFLEF